MKINTTKILTIIVILIFAVLADQLTKIWAENNLASPRYPDHQIEKTVEGLQAPVTFQEYIHQTFPAASAEERNWIIQSANITLKENNIPPLPDDIINNGDTLLLQYHTINIIPGYWDFIYARNPGAAWSFLADADETFRKYFFGITSLIALALLSIFLVSSKWPAQAHLIISLSFVMGGAIGNLIDRFRFGYVIDFISWHIGEKYAWPTFNIADAFITVGAAILIVELFISARKNSPETDNEKTKTA